MGLKPDHWIRKMAREQGMIEPYVDGQVRSGVISYGVSSYGYDIRVADEFKIFTNVFSAIVDPKNFSTQSMVDFKGDVCVIPPNSFALARTIEYFRIPRKVLTICLGKCLSGDTLVVDAETGDYLPLRDFVGSRRPATISASGWKKGWKGNWMLGKRAVRAHTYNGAQPVFLLTTRAGLKIKATGTHPFLTQVGWKALQNLQAGEQIAAAKTCPVFGNDELPEHEAVLLGLYLAGGGCLAPGQNLSRASRDPVVGDALAKAIQDFAERVSLNGRAGSAPRRLEGMDDRQMEERVYAWLETAGCHSKPTQVKIPALVFRAQKTGAASFLRALFSAGGRARSAKSNEGFFLEYQTVSAGLADGLHHLLLRFGIFATVNRTKLKTGRLVCRLQITGEEMVGRFQREIGFLPGSEPDKALITAMGQLEAAYARSLSFESLGFPGRSPARIVGRDEMLDAGRTIGAVSVWVAGQGQAAQQNKTAQQVQEAPIVQTNPWGGSRAAHMMPHLPEPVDSDVIWDEVLSIESAGIEEVYDLTVPGAENFLANGLIVHNSTYARCGIIVNVTPFEPEWEGFVTLEISNTTPLPAKIYSREGIAQVLFFEADEECEISYADKKGKYQKQQTIELPKL